MADPKRAFDIKVRVKAGGHTMSGTTKAPSLGELVEHTSERFGIRLCEIRELVIESSTIKVKITPAEIAIGESS